MLEQACQMAGWECRGLIEPKVNGLVAKTSVSCSQCSATSKQTTGRDHIPIYEKNWLCKTAT